MIIRIIIGSFPSPLPSSHILPHHLHNDLSYNVTKHTIIIKRYGKFRNPTSNMNLFFPILSLDRNPVMIDLEGVEYQANFLLSLFLADNKTEECLVTTITLSLPVCVTEEAKTLTQQ